MLGIVKHLKRLLTAGGLGKLLLLTSDNPKLNFEPKATEQSEASLL